MDTKGCTPIFFQVSIPLLIVDILQESWTDLQMQGVTLLGFPPLSLHISLALVWLAALAKANQLTPSLQLQGSV